MCWIDYVPLHFIEFLCLTVLLGCIIMVRIHHEMWTPPRPQVKRFKGQRDPAEGILIYVDFYKDT